ncbi:uncharacterized protein FOMMEDRAFT_140581 [Fomitiporia mediterranea MF3/22]|uniref:uncharacterized protein n=1 Tax=Fomitiporia mediterranea (strain MF3/22) TaxID=694068 RepID=UPI000440766D|nr:uncharacterized protein FOMMEDRAFT_140581 [Fomitiporia mediterranea MF3/22]EJD02671.1 hypothetical protein FOMMEDRAFT_140581 [Fomitiporia mediterranea MF3/22]
MPPSKCDRHMVMDSDLLLSSHPPAFSRTSSYSVVDNKSALAAGEIDHRRRSSASQIIPIVSQAVYSATPPSGPRRSPLAPLDHQFSSASNKDMDSPDEDAYQSGRKSSITLTNKTRPTPYTQRNPSRRHAPGQQRRTSLPSLQPSHEPPPPLPSLPPANPVSPYELAITHEEDSDIYSRLSTFTFGDPQSSAQQTAASGAASSSHAPPPSDDTEGISPLDKTPRPSVAHAYTHIPKSHEEQSAANGWSSQSEDEEDRRRTNTRSKMRAIDDGTRRPSLPSNDVQQQQYWSGSAISTDVENRRTTSEGRGDREHGRHGPLPISPASPTDGEAELDTDVDLMSIDDTADRRRRGMYHGMSDHSSVHLNSDVGSAYGEADDRIIRHTEGEGEGEAMDEDEDGSGAARKDSARTWVDTSERRGSLPMDIPYPASYSSSRSSHAYAPSQHPHLEDATFDAHARAQAQLRRPSRSVDDDLQRAALHLQRKASRVPSATSGGSGSDTAGREPSSEPDMRGVAMAQAIAQAHLDAQAESGAALNRGAEPGSTNDEPYQGLDLNYILSVTGGSGAGLDTRGSDSWSGRLSVGSSVVAARDLSWAAGWGISHALGRRQSTATVNDDTFLRFVKKHDFSYDERKREWTFAREHREPDLHHSMKPGQEIWRCLWVGRYRVEKIQSKNVDPSRPPQARLQIKHLPDPYSKGSATGGPQTFIHKHSRAQAFSIFRGFVLPTRHLKTSSSILLAPKKVQEQFTSTRTTAKLSTHGLLDDSVPSTASSSRRDREREREQTASGSTVASAATSTTSVSVSGLSHSASTTEPSSWNSKTSFGAPAGEQRTTNKLRLKTDMDSGTETRNTVDRKGKGKDVAVSPVDLPPSSSHSHTSGGNYTAPSPDRDRGSSDADTPHSRTVMQRPYVEHPHRPVDMDTDTASFNRPVSSLAETASVVSDSSQQFSSSISNWDQSSIGSSTRQVRKEPNLIRQVAKLPTQARGSIGSLDEEPVRTSHAEAFATLDAPFIEYLRSHAANYDTGSEHDSQPSKFKGLRKLFHPPPLKSLSKQSPQAAGTSVAVLEGHYTPPWLTMAARSKQEEQERVIKNLNDSFRDVGLLPSFKPSRNRQNKKGKHTSDNVFDQIPDDSLYMLLPMWPGETDPDDPELMDFPLGKDGLDIPLHERQYLLVYYVPNELSKESKDNSGDKKRARTQTASASSHASDATLVTGKGASKNTVALSSFNILARLVSYKDVLGSGIRIPTTGLAISGPMSEGIAAIPQIRFQVDDLALMIAFCASRERGVEVVPEGVEKLGLCLPRTNPDPDSDAPLSPLGRAAVEMAWLGALAIMGFNLVGL